MQTTILVIEEDDDLGRLFESLLQVAGYSVMLAQSVYEARQLIEKRLPDLIVFDWSITNTTGYLWVDQMRTSERYADLPIMLVCDTTPPRSVIEMLGNIGVPLIEKPFDLALFSRYVKALLAPSERAVGAA